MRKGGAREVIECQARRGGEPTLRRMSLGEDGRPMGEILEPSAESVEEGGRAVGKARRVSVVKS